MRIIVLDAPLGHKFDPDMHYLVYIPKEPNKAFVVDDDCEPCFLSDMEWEEVTSET